MGLQIPETIQPPGQPQGLRQPTRGGGVGVGPGDRLGGGWTSGRRRGTLGRCGGSEGGRDALGRGDHAAAAPAAQLLGLWDSPRSRELLPGLLRADRSSFCARRDVSRRCRLRPGHYLVVPSAANAGDEADFTLRVFSERCHTAV